MLQPSRDDGARSPRLLRGFSLFELLIVIACLAVVAILVLPSAGDTAGASLSAAARLLIADLEYAQMQSMGNGLDPSVVVFEPSASRYHLARSSSPGTPLMDPGTGLPYVSQFGSGRALCFAGVSLDGLSLDGDSQLGYTASGALDQGTDAAITLRCAGQTLQIVVQASTGEPEVK